MNQLNEQLRSIRVQLAVLELHPKANEEAIRQLKKEEKECLKTLNIM